MSYFKKIQSLDDLKERFKKLAREHHPDAGGDGEIMKQINMEYDALFAVWKHRREEQTGEVVQETAESTRRRFYTQNGWEGKNYDSELTLKDIAKIVRTYVKEEYPTYKFSVRTKYASMVQELHVDLLESPIGIYKTFDELTDADKIELIKKAERNDYFHLTSWNDAELQEELERIWKEHGNFYKCLNDVTSHVISDVDNFVNSYNYNDSDGMIDYFDVNFYYFGCAQNNGMNIKVVPKTARIKNKEGTLKQAQKTRAEDGSQKAQEIFDKGIYFPKTFEEWMDLGMEEPQAHLIYELESVLSIPDTERIAQQLDVEDGSYDWRFVNRGLSDQQIFDKYAKLKNLVYLSQKIEGVELGNFEWDEELYLHFTAMVDGYELEGLFRTSDPQNGEDMELVSIDYGYNHSQIKEQWDNIEKFLKSYASEKYADITKKVNESKELQQYDKTESLIDIIQEIGELEQLIGESEQLSSDNGIEFPKTFEEWHKLGFDQPRLIHELESVLPIPDAEKITSYWGDMGEYEFKGNVSEQEVFERYNRLRELERLSQKIEGVELGNFEWDEDNYLHFTATVDGYELEGLFRTSDPQNGEDMELVSIDYGYSHSRIKEQWDNIEEFLKKYSADKYNEISHSKVTIEEENYQELLKLAPDIINGKRNQMEFTAGKNFYSLSIENIGDNRISMMHYYIVNGDVVRDPDIEFALDEENQTLIPKTYRQWDNYQSVENSDGTTDKILQDDLNSFTKQWFTNLNAQGYIPVEKVIENIRNYENSIGMSENKRITELDEDNHIHLIEGDEHIKDYVKYSRKCEEYLRFGYEVDEATSGALSNIERIKICDTPEILLKAGLEQKPMLYTQGHLAEALSPKERRNPHKHGLTIEQVKSLPEQFEEPVIIANNPSREDALLMVLCATDNDKLPLIISVKPDGKGFYELEEVETNMVLTVFGKNNFQHYFESALLPDNIVYINKEKSQMLERLCERQLFTCYSSIDFNTIIQKPECVVNMENQKYARIIQVPEISFDEWLETSEYDKQRFPSEAERVEAMMGQFETHTQHSYGVLKGKQDKVEYYHKAYEAYQEEVKDGKIPLTEKRFPLDLSKEQDRAFCRMEIKRLEKQGNYKEVNNWKNYYNKNSPKEPNKSPKSTYNKIQHEELGTKLENTEGRLQQGNLVMAEDANLEFDIEM